MKQVSHHRYTIQKAAIGLEIVAQTERAGCPQRTKQKRIWLETYANHKKSRVTNRNPKETEISKSESTERSQIEELRYKGRSEIRDKIIAGIEQIELYGYYGTFSF